ncbi:MAG: sigma-70 family RNA polymerase sigma factor [Planctomycetota bacterium]|nr:sigma-70 family RNA polymerase sigma factor [Planctomycetota bacterium]
MAFIDSNSPPGGRGFHTTAWGLISQSRKGDEEEKSNALDRLVSIYWRPVYWTIRLDWNKKSEEAKDLTQEYFFAFLEKQMVEDVQKEKGRFRAYVKATLKNFMLTHKRSQQALKRGGGRKIVGLEDLQQIEKSSTAQEEPPDKRFDRELMRSIMQKALDELQNVCEKKGKIDHFHLFEAYYHREAAGEKISYDDFQKQFEISFHDVKNRLTDMRNRFREIIVQFLQDGLSSEEELISEIKEVFES